MKTLLVLSALATIAIAAPAPDEYTDEVKFTPNDFTLLQQREKKSTILQPFSDKSSEVFESKASEITTNKSELGSSVARTFSGFKKPIIVKKKVGYQLYRDSDEEQAQADPRESCRKQIKVKLCDDLNSVDKEKSASIDHTHEPLLEHEIEHNIKMAKEAVEMFQRDLRKMDHDISDKTRQDHMAIEDKDLQEDIEKARVALEHIQRKFRNFDLITASKEVDNSDMHFKMIKSEEDKLAQWKKAIDNNNNNFEIARNLEDNFKMTNDFDKMKSSSSMNLEEDNLSNVKARQLNDVGINMRLVGGENNLNTHIQSKGSDSDDTMTSVTEDKETKMDIHSDSLKKSKSASEDVKPSIQTLEPHSQIDLDKETSNISNQRKSEPVMNGDCNDKDNLNKNEQGRVHENEDSEKKINTAVALEGHDTMVKLSNRNTENELGSSKTSVDTSTHNNQQSEQLRSSKLDDLATHESQHMIDSHNMKNHNEHVQQQIDAQRSTPLEMQQTLNSEAKEREVHQQRNSLLMSISDWDNQKQELVNLISQHFNKPNINETSASERATTSFHKELLNNMDFSEDSHQTGVEKLSLKEPGHMLKNEKPELHERFNVPQLHPDSEHLKTMMQFSDNSQHNTLHPSQLKMASKFNSDSPNFNGHSNVPLREAVELHNQHENTVQLLSKASSPLSNIPMDLHDPLKIRWAHDNNMNIATMKDAQPNSQFPKGDTEMLEDTQRLNFEKSMPFRSNSADGQHLKFNDQMNTRWAQQSMSGQKSADINSGLDRQNVQSNLHMNDDIHHSHPVSKNVNNFDGFINQDTFMSSNDHMMMHSSHNLDSSMQPSTFMNMRSMPKMAFEQTGPNHWARNHGAYRSSYGPGIASYGSGPGASSGSSGGSNTVGYFPNANVGNCAVPLLLSCSPSVVSGTLAKTNSYSAPAYRSEDVNFLKKRDIDISQATPGVKVQRHATETHKPHLILEKKQ